MRIFNLTWNTQSHTDSAAPTETRALDAISWRNRTQKIDYTIDALFVCKVFPDNSYLWFFVLARD